MVVEIFKVVVDGFRRFELFHVLVITVLKNRESTRTC